MAEVDNLIKSWETKKTARTNEDFRIKELKERIAKSEKYIAFLKKEYENKIKSAENHHNAMLKSLESGQEFVTQVTSEIEQLELKIETSKD